MEATSHVRVAMARTSGQLRLAAACYGWVLEERATQCAAHHNAGTGPLFSTAIAMT